MPVARCIHCNYQLQQITTTRCPECGNDFNPADALTVNYGRELTHWARWSLAPAGRLAAGALAGAAVAEVWFARLPPRIHDRTLINSLLLTLLGILWLGWSMLRHVAVRRNRWRSEWFVRNRPIWRWPGVLAVVLGIASSLGMPQRIAFRLSERSMVRLVQPIVGTHVRPPNDQWAGLFRATLIKRIPEGAIFTTTKDPDGEAGFVYLPKLDPKRPTWNSRQYIGDGWWTWREER